MSKETTEKGIKKFSKEEKLKILENANSRKPNCRQESLIEHPYTTTWFTILEIFTLASFQYAK